MDVKTLTAHRLAYYVRHFATLWGKSLQQRATACKFYADAVNSGNLLAQVAFQAIDGFTNLRPKQWRLMRLVGSGVIIPEYLDAHDAAVPNCMARCKVSHEDQKDIWNNGLAVGTLSGRTVVKTMDTLQAHHIAQVYIQSTGNKRSVQAQVKWLEEHVRPNLEVLDHSVLRVGHACFISKDELANLLPELFTSAELTTIARNNKRGARK